MAMRGFFNKILIIDLARRTAKTEEVPDEVYRDYLGGKGLATWLLQRDNPPRVDPFSPENRLIFAVGPLTDIKVHGSARFGVFTKSPLTNFYCESYSGGTVSDHLSRTGYDAVILQGAADSPVWLEVSDHEVQFHSADDLWGQAAYAAEDALLAAVAKPLKAAVVIGPAGERLVRFATINNNYWRCAGRAGVGAVMGSKKVKGIVFHGETRRRAASPELLLEHWRALAKKARTDKGVAAYKKYGTVQMVKAANLAGVFPTRYWTSDRREDWQKISAETMNATCKVRPQACPRCFMACGRLTEILEGRHKGLIIEGPEYETIFAFGGLGLIETLPEIAYLNDLCDRLGLDTITAGNLVAFAMLASERGKIPEKIPFGDADKAAELIAQIAKREGLGAVLAEGIVHAARAWGMEEDAVHVKGLEPAGYDPRKLKGMGLGYAVSPRGACHLRATFYKPELSGMIAKEQIAGKAELFIDFEDRATLFDALILCRFYRDLLPWDQLATLVRGATGLELDKNELQKIAARITDATRRFNLREGLTPADDSLPKKFLSQKISGDEAGLTEDELKIMVQDYYRLRGWDENGLPPRN